MVFLTKIEKARSIFLYSNYYQFTVDLFVEIEYFIYINRKVYKWGYYERL